MVERLFLAMPRGCLQFVIVVFPDHAHLLFLIPFLCLKLYSLNFAIAHAQKKIVVPIRIRHTCVELIHKKTVLSLETSSEIKICKKRM